MEHLRITVAGKVYDVIVEKIEGDESEGPITPAPVARAAVPTPAPRTAVAATPPKAAAEGDATSPLAGLVQAVAVAPGATVSAGDLIITLEAMKMYTSINATTSGTIEAIHVEVGDAVEEGQVLYTIR